MDMNKPLDAVMFYFNRFSPDIIFRQELENIARQMPSFRLVNVLTEPEEGWKGEQGKLDEAMLRKLVPDPDGLFFWVSGSPGMAGTCRELLELIGVREHNIRTDRFMGY
jgi:ferredoxin-NADP reductase